MKTKYFRLIPLFFMVSSLSFSAAAQPEGTTSFNNSQMLNLANQDRSAEGLAPLSESAELDLAANLKLDDMAAHSYFEHISPQGKSPWYFIQQAGYEYRSAAENLALNFSDAQTLEEAWMQSAEHRKNLLNPSFTEMGIARKQLIFNGQPATFAVEMFGSPAHAELTVRN